MTFALSGAFFGVDFNPAANALRIVSDSGQILRHLFVNLQTATTVVDGALHYNGIAATSVTGAAYTNNDVEPIRRRHCLTYTSLNQVNVQSPANSGSLAPTGMLTVDADTAVGFGTSTIGAITTVALHR